jgi:NitT/TauT family transport system permease protein
MVFLVAWELVVRTLRINELLLPAPSRIAMELVEVSGKGFLWGPLGESLEALALGLVMGVVVGVGLGMLIGASSRLESLTMPYLWALRATPRIALAPLVMIWLGFRLEAKVFLVFLSVSIIVMLIVLESVKTVDGSLIRVARSFGANRKDIVTKVITPYILPSIATGIRNGIGFGFVSVLVVEMFSAVGGLGAQVRRARDSYDSPRMFAFILVLIVVSLALINLSRRFEAHVSRWREEAYVA